MARPTDQFRRSDVTLWGSVAAAVAALALLSANVAQLTPAGLLAGLHSSRAAPATVEHEAVQAGELTAAQQELVRLVAAQQQLQAETARLAAQFDGLVEQAGGLRSRVTELESALPRVVRTLPVGPAIDTTLVTGSIGTGTPAAFNAPAAPAADGSVKVTRSPLPLPPTEAPDDAADEPMPAPVAVAPANPESVAAPLLAAIGPWSEQAPGAPADAGLNDVAAPAIADGNPAPVPLAPKRRTHATRTATAAVPPARTAANAQPIGIAVGAAVPPETALKAWEKLAGRVGIMLVGLSPRLAEDPAGGGGKVLVAGPIASLAVATTLCADIARAGIACMPVPYAGAELSAAQR